MPNFHADKARGLLNLADEKRKDLATMRENAKTGDGVLPISTIHIRMNEISDLVATAQVHATLATVDGSPAVEYHGPESAEAPSVDEEDVTAVAFFDTLGDTLEFLHAASPLFQFFAGRPDKDTPRA